MRKCPSPKARANLEKCKRYFCGFGQTQRVAGSATKASFKASITASFSDSVAVLKSDLADISFIHFMVKVSFKIWVFSLKPVWPD